ncbi:hypothetical protein H6G41_26645 [Tolypothrix sp. FACHB-123]|uniref:hypothetical protein n=1 Tax=Tolypothrix sp. FACHB-123 TaxID=2692868 RepID=UPI00168997B9|nr:hypothetical protein [Tolypothrix sp. FACHB-123]MBD2358147.1 hypothetical protein [Tolypothrix sp. FACHB-123]
MTTEITLNLPDEVYRRAEHLAQMVNRNVAEVLTEAIALSLSPVSPQSSNSALIPSVTSLSDNEVLALSELQMPTDQDHQLSELLDRQQAGTLSDAERPYLTALMQVYQEKLLLKAQALREAVQRGLRASLES